MYHYCSLIFSAHNPFSGFWNMNSVKIWTYRGKFLYYVPIFSSVRTYTKKNICYVPCKCHNRTFLPLLRLYVPFGCFRRTFFVIVLSICPMQLPQQDIFAILSPICPTSLCTGIFFDLYPLYVPSDSFSRFLCRTEMFRKGKSVYLLVSITKTPGNTQLNVLPPPSSFVFRHHPQSVFLSHPYDNFSS